MSSKHQKALLVATTLLGAFFPVQALLAEHPHKVVKLEANENFYEAYQAFLKLSTRNRTPEALIAGARSAWALSLPDQALQIFRYALSRSLELEQEGEVLLSTAVIHYQERELDAAEAIAKKVLARFTTTHPFRGRAFYILGEVESHRGNLQSSLTYLERALDESSSDLIPTVSYLQGRVLSKLLRNEEARRAFERVPVNHELAGEAVRRLAILSIEDGDFEQAEFWLLKGREQHKALFLDSWVDYAFLKVAIAQGDPKQAEEIVEAAAKRYPPSDAWLVLLSATAENYLYSRASLGDEVVVQALGGGD